MANGVTQIRRSVLTLALPVTVSSLLQRTEGIVAVFLVGGLGAIPIAAVGLGQLLAFIATTLVSGLSVGTNVIIAQLWGARRHQDAGQAAWHFLGLAIAVSLALMTCGVLLNQFAMQLLGAESDVIALALLVLSLAAVAAVILPRMGYARMPGTWRCVASPAS